MRKRFLKETRQILQMIALALTAGFIGVNSVRAVATTLAQASANKPKVVATTSVLCDVAKKIAQDTIDLKCLIDPGADPHEYQPKPEDRKAIEEAKLVLFAGYNFEPGLIRMIYASSNPAPKIAVDEDAVRVPQWFEDDGKRVIDPHVFHNAQNGVEIVKVVSENLTKLEPSQSELYTANAQKMTGELSQIHTWIKSEIATIPEPQRKLVTTHDAFGYYSKAYGIDLAGALQGVTTDEQITPSRVAELVKGIKQSRVTTIFAEATINPKLIRAVAREANVKVSDRQLFGDGIGEPGTDGDSYEKMLVANTKTIVQGLGGRYTDFQLNSTTTQPVTTP